MLFFISSFIIIPLLCPSFILVVRPPGELGKEEPNFPERNGGIDHLSFVLVTDSTSHTVRKLHLNSGSLTTLLGVDNLRGTAVGTKFESRLDEPQGMALLSVTPYSAESLNFNVSEPLVNTRLKVIFFLADAHWIRRVEIF